MIIALKDHNQSQQFSEDIKALAAKKEKCKSTTEKKKPTKSPITPPSTTKDKRKERCKYRGSERHVKKLCYYFMPANQRPVNLEPYYGKKHLLLENLPNA